MTLAGKRKFLGGRSQVNTKGAADVIQHNSQQVMTECYKAKNVKPLSPVKKVEGSRQIKHMRTREMSANKGRDRKYVATGQKKFYGESAETPKLTEEEYQIRKDDIIDKLK